jgi:HPt (histidine-containing phosphotransfer) domain-containing protein
VDARLDPDLLHQLIEDLGDDELVVELAQELVAALPDRLAALRRGAAAVGVPDVDDARRAAHTLKSSARLMGLTALAERAALLEATTPPWSAELLSDLDVVASEAAEALRDWVATALVAGPQGPRP